jgi:glycosyltransferase domain-containing protein
MEHTIILRTRNRPGWLRNCINHYSELNYKGIILIGDDSDTKNFMMNEFLVAEYSKNLRIQHIQGEGNSETTRVRRVFVTTHQLYSLVSTKYFSVSSDDDFLFPDFINKGIEFLDLEINKDISCVHGPEIKLYYDKNLEIKDRKFKEWKPSLEQDPLERLINYARNRSLAYEGVCRSSLIELLHNAQEGSFGFMRASKANLSFFDEEIPWVMQVYIGGKVYYQSNHVMGIRGIHQGEDRIENLFLDNNNKVFYLGPISEFSLDETPKALREAHASIVQLIKKIRSNYSDQVIDDVVWQVFWYLFTSYRVTLTHPLMISSGKSIHDGKKLVNIKPLILRILRKYSVGILTLLRHRILLSSSPIKNYMKSDTMKNQIL